MNTSDIGDEEKFAITLKCMSKIRFDRRGIGHHALDTGQRRVVAHGIDPNPNG